MSSGLKAGQSHTCKGPAAGGTGDPLSTTSCTSLPRDTSLSIHPISPAGRAQLECLFNAGSLSPEKAVVCTGGHSRVSYQEAVTWALDMVYLVPTVEVLTGRTVSSRLDSEATGPRFKSRAEPLSDKIVSQPLCLSRLTGNVGRLDVAAQLLAWP